MVLFLDTKDPLPPSLFSFPVEHKFHARRNSLAGKEAKEKMMPHENNLYRDSILGEINHHLCDFFFFNTSRRFQGVFNLITWVYLLFWAIWQAKFLLFNYQLGTNQASSSTNVKFVLLVNSGTDRYLYAFRYFEIKRAKIQREKNDMRR